MKLFYIFLLLVIASWSATAQEDKTMRLNSGNKTAGPLYVINNVVTRDINYASSLANPNDIESIEVLKDVLSVAKYGRDGVNGVIIIHTKKYIRRTTLNKLAAFSKKFQSYLKAQPDSVRLDYMIDGHKLSDSLGQVPYVIVNLPKSAIRKVDFKKPKDEEKAIVKITTKP